MASMKWVQYFEHINILITISYDILSTNVQIFY
ncbi:hypothetical protein HNQ91_001815 [Filimonas zeae]|nr:hypothetical protein [Filimonas zeae]